MGASNDQIKKLTSDSPIEVSSAKIIINQTALIINKNIDQIRYDIHTTIESIYFKTPPT